MQIQPIGMLCENCGEKIVECNNLCMSFVVECFWSSAKAREGRERAAWAEEEEEEEDKRGIIFSFVP
jgi:hypothetical protein